MQKKFVDRQMTDRQNDGKIGKERYNIKIIWTVDRWTDEQINLKIYRHNNVAAQVGQPPPPPRHITPRMGGR